MILNTKTFEIIYGLQELCIKENLHLGSMSNKLTGKSNNNSIYVYVKEIYPELQEKYFTPNSIEFNILRVFNYQDRSGGGDLAIVQIVESGKKAIIWDRKLAEYVEINDFF